MDGYKQPKAYIATQGLYYIIQLDKNITETVHYNLGI